MFSALHPRLVATPLSLPTERAELAAEWQVEDAFRGDDARMLAVNIEVAREEPSASPPCASTPALDHPSLPGFARRAASLGYQLAVDTSLRDNPNMAGLPRAATTLLAHLQTVGAYFSWKRKCIGLAEDSAWHEAVHEMIHLEFDARGLNPSVRGGGGLPPTEDASPLHTHWRAYRARGYSALAAEELVAREHELRSLTASGAPPWRWAVRALCIADSALVVAQNDLSSKPAAERTPAHAAESRRVHMYRSLVTGPRPRLAYAALPLIGATMLVSSAVRWRQQQRVDGEP